MESTPFFQGSLDSMCGIYSILNSYKIVMNANQENCQNLFNEIIEYLSRKRLLKNILIGGMDFKHMKMVMNDVVYNYMPHYKISWASFPNPKTRVFWDSMKDHLEKENNCILFGTTGVAEHWSVGVHCTTKTMKLMDANWKYMKYSSCTTTILDNEKVILYPAQTFYISNEEF